MNIEDIVKKDLIEHGNNVVYYYGCNSNLFEKCKDCINDEKIENKITINVSITKD
jgi:hypothetical protein